MRTMGLDIGTKRIGMAVSDQTGTIACGLGWVCRKNEKTALEKIKGTASEYSVSTIVVGMPFNMDGTKGAGAVDAERFGGKIVDMTGLNVVFWDERLSTREVQNILIGSSVKRKKRKMVVDKIAAQIILQGYLDSGTGL